METAAGAPVAVGVTDANGRVDTLASDVAVGRYRLRWDLSERAGFLVEVAVVVELAEDRQYHIPLLASPVAAVSYLGA